MKKFLINIFLFFGLVMVVDLVFDKLCNFLTDHAKGGFIREVKISAKEQTADLLIMGSSRAHRHYVPSVFSDTLGMTAHNTGVDGNGIVTAAGLYPLISARYRPVVVIYDVTTNFDIYEFAGDGNDTRYLGALRPYYGESGVNKVLEMVDPNERYKNISAMFRYNSKIVDLVKDQFYTGNFRDDGYLPLYKTMLLQNANETEEGENSDNVGKALQSDSLKLKLFESFVVDVKHSGASLFVVASPLYGATSSKMFDPVRAICLRNNVEFWDYYTDSTFQHVKYFADHAHMNDVGAQFFSKKLASKLKTKR